MTKLINDWGEKRQKYDTGSLKDIYIAAAAAITWLIKYNQRICYIIINSRSVFLLALLWCKNEFLKMLHLLDFINIFGLICGFCNFLFLLSLNPSLKVNKKHTCFISFAINDLERWLFSLLTCLLLIHACYNFLFLVSMKGQHKNVFALLVVSARASPFTKLGFGGGG